MKNQEDNHMDAGSTGTTQKVIRAQDQNGDPVAVRRQQYALYH